MRAGFGYELNTLANGETNVLVRAFMDLFSPNQTGAAIGYMAHWVPLLRWIVRISQSHRSTPVYRLKPLLISPQRVIEP